jgi:hypothetical protein
VGQKKGKKILKGEKIMEGGKRKGKNWETNVGIRVSSGLRDLSHGLVLLGLVCLQVLFASKNCSFTFFPFVPLCLSHLSLRFIFILYGALANIDGDGRGLVNSTNKPQVVFSNVTHVARLGVFLFPLSLPSISPTPTPSPSLCFHFLLCDTLAHIDGDGRGLVNSADKAQVVIRNVAHVTRLGGVLEDQGAVLEVHVHVGGLALGLRAIDRPNLKFLFLNSKKKLGGKKWEER